MQATRIEMRIHFEESDLKSDSAEGAEADPEADRSNGRGREYLCITR